MGVESRAWIAAELIARGRPAGQPVAFLERSSLASERIVESTLEAVAAGKVAVVSPAVFVIGEVVRLRARSESSAAAEIGDGELK
jgi:uroporphyrin-III C-methyltransferase